MTVCSLTLRERIVVLFEKHRATPGAPYDDGDFMDFLLAEPKRRRAVLDGVRALRRLNAFMDEVQYELAICFSPQDRKAHYSMQGLVQRVAELADYRVGSRPRLKSRVASGIEWPATLLANIVLLVAAVSLRNHAGAVLTSGFIAMIVNTWFATFLWKVVVNCRHLQSRIEAEASRTRRRPPDNNPSPSGYRVHAPQRRFRLSTPSARTVPTHGRAAQVFDSLTDASEAHFLGNSSHYRGSKRAL
jgi:hypothetical protein